MNLQDDIKLKQLVQRIDPHSQFRRAWHPAGGVSAQVTALEIAQTSGLTTKLLVRRHGAADLTRNPNIARDEFRLLQIAHGRGLAVPRPVYVDESCDVFPTPYLVVEYIDGVTEFAPADVGDYVRQAATQLAKIHGLRDSPELSFLPRHGSGFGERPDILDTSLDERRIRDILEAVRSVPHINEPVVLHGDFWPGNLLWQAGKLVAVVDWEDASVGDPLVDLANTRLEILWAFGIDAMNAFTNHYTSLAAIDVTQLPYWDLCAALRPCSKLSGWGLDPATQARMRERHALFTSQAFELLSGR